MKYELNDVQTLSVSEVVEQLITCGALEIDCGERLGEARLECGCDLEIDILHDDQMDMRIHGCLSHTETFTREDIREAFDQADYYTLGRRTRMAKTCCSALDAERRTEAMTTDTIESVPEWATTYLMYGDDTGLNASDKWQCDHFLAGLRRDGYRLIAPIEGTHNECCSYPAFGMACATEDWTAEDMNADKRRN